MSGIDWDNAEVIRLSPKQPYILDQCARCGGDVVFVCGGCGEMFPYDVSAPVPALLCEPCSAAEATDEAPPDVVGTRGHGPDERAHDLVSDILNGRVTRPARDQIKDAIGRAEKSDAAAPKPMPRGAMR